jgi:hypothetical protein
MAPPDSGMDVDEDYTSEEDSDFAPEDAPANESSPSDDEDEGDEEAAAQRKRKRAAPEPEAEDAGFENSGDEAIIDKGKKRAKKPKAKEAAVDEDGDDGPLIKTRSMRAVEYVHHIMGQGNSLTDYAGRPSGAQQPPAGPLQSMSTRYGRR